MEDRKKIALQNLAHWDALGAQRLLTQLELERKADGGVQKMGPTGGDHVETEI